MTQNENYFDKLQRSWREDFEFENGNYENICCICKKHFLGYKRRVKCKLCATGKKYLGQVDENRYSQHFPAQLDSGTFARCEHGCTCIMTCLICWSKFYILFGWVEDV